MSVLALELGGPEFLSLLLNTIATGQVERLITEIETKSTPVAEIFREDREKIIEFLRKVNTARPIALSLMERGNQINKELRNAAKN